MGITLSNTDFIGHNGHDGYDGHNQYDGYDIQRGMKMTSTDSNSPVRQGTRSVQASFETKS